MRIHHMTAALANVRCSCASRCTAPSCAPHCTECVAAAQRSWDPALGAAVAALLSANREVHALDLQEHVDTLHDNTSDEAGLPLEGSRSVTINTNEGTWLSVDVHPDGQSLVFDLLGDLYGKRSRSRWDPCSMGGTTRMK